MPTILELFRGAGLDKQVKPDRLTGVEQELKGVRFKSAVEVNNPLIYGNEATRIALRSTPEKDKMIESKKPDGAPAQGEGGLLGKGLGKITKGKVNSVNQLRDKVNSALGVPQTLIPSSYINTEGLDDPNLGIQSGYEERLIKIKDNAKGSFVGGLLSGMTLTMGAADEEMSTVANTTDRTEGTVALTGSIGNLKYGFQKDFVDAGQTAALTDAIFYKIDQIGFAYAVNDALSISYNRMEQSQHNPNAGSHFTQDTDAISVGYTVGGMTIGIQDASTDNANMVEDVKDDVRSISLSVAF